MARIILIAIVVVAALVMSRKLRGIVFHMRVRRFLFIFTTVCFLALLGASGYYAWKYWWPIYMKQPTVEWTDTTIEHDSNPETPGAGGPVVPTLIQVR